MQVVRTFESVAVNEYSRVNDDRGRRLKLEILEKNTRTQIVCRRYYYDIT